MRVKYRISVDHRGDAPVGILFELDGVTYSITAVDGRISEIDIVVPNFPMASLPKITSTSEQVSVPEISIPSDPLWPDVERNLMFLEGVLSMFGLRKVSFEERTVEWLPDNDEEREAIQISSFRVTRREKSGFGPVAYDMFARSLLVSKQLSHLEVALNFNRRGKEDLGGENYISAIYNFYFVIESLFADGKFKKKDVLSKFLAADCLVEAVEKSKRTLTKDVDLRGEVFPKRSMIYFGGSAREVLGEIINVRGYLHHHSGKRLDSWHPHRSSEYRLDAIFLSQVCFAVLGDMVFKEMYSEELIARFSRIEFSSPDGKRINFVPYDL